MTVVCRHTLAYIPEGYLAISANAAIDIPLSNLLLRSIIGRMPLFSKCAGTSFPRRLSGLQSLKDINFTSSMFTS